VSKMQQWQTQWKNLAMNFWQQRNRREQFMLTGAAGFVMLTLIFSLLISPAMTGRERLQNSLPLARRQSVTLQQLLLQAGTLSKKPETAATPLTQSDIELALTRSNLHSKSIIIAGDSAKLELVAADMSGLLIFLQDMQKTASLHVSDAKFTATSKPGLIDATITLRQTRGQ